MVTGQPYAAPSKEVLYSQRSGEASVTISRSSSSGVTGQPDAASSTRVHSWSAVRSSRRATISRSSSSVVSGQSDADPPTDAMYGQLSEAASMPQSAGLQSPWSLISQMLPHL